MNNIAKKPPIEKLTAEQEALLPVYEKKWQDIATDIGPADRAKAEAGMRDTYKRENLPDIKLFLWFISPVSMVLGFMSCDAIEKGVTLTQLETLCWPTMTKLLPATFEDARTQVQDFYNHLKNTNQLPAVTVSDKEALGVFNQCKQDFPWQFGYGQHDANWLAFYEFFKDACGLVEETEALTGLWEVAKHSGWYLPYMNDAETEGRVFMCEKQAALHLDDRGRPHNTEGAFYEAKDGTKVYYVAGIEVGVAGARNIGYPEYITNPSTLTVEAIGQETNVEKRRILIDLYESPRSGREKGAYILDSGATQIHQDDFGTLYKKELQGDEPIVVVKVTNSTPEPDGSYKDYYLRVPPTVSTAREAVAWTFDLKPEEYAPQVQT